MNEQVIPFRIDPNDYKMLSINSFIRTLQLESQKCRYGNNYYTIIYYTVFISVAIISGLVIPIISYLNTANIFNDKTIKYLNITIGILSIIVAFGHSAINFLEIDSKRNHFRLLHNMYQRKKNKFVTCRNLPQLLTLNDQELAIKLQKGFDSINQNKHYQFPHFLESHIDKQAKSLVF